MSEEELEVWLNTFRCTQPPVRRFLARIFREPLSAALAHLLHVPPSPALIPVPGPRPPLLS